MTPPFAENGQKLELGDGLWRAFTAEEREASR
jgi:hypothetical protein